MNYEEFKYKLNDILDKVKGRRRRLIIVLAREPVLKRLYSDLSLESININLLLSEKLLELPINKRNRSIGAFFNSLFRVNNSDVILLNNYNLLFLPELNQDVIRLFEDLSKERTIIVVWCGKYENGKLIYGEPWHREYKEYSHVDAEIINII